MKYIKSFTNTSTYACIVLYSFMTGVEYAIILPTIWQYISQDFQANGWFMGLALSSFNLSAIVSGLLIGKISDTYVGYSKTILLVTNAFEIMGNLLYIIAFNKWLLVLSRFICGLGMGASPALIAQIARHTHKSERTLSLIYIMGARQLGLILGPVFNVFLSKLNFTFVHIAINNRNAPGFFMFIAWFLIQIIFGIFYVDLSNTAKVENHCNKNDTNNFYANDIDEFESRPLSSMSTTSLLTHETGSSNENKSLSARKSLNVMFVLYVTIFTTYFNQTALETVLSPFTQTVFNWSEKENSELFGCAGVEILFAFFLVRLLSRFFKDRWLLVFGLFIMTVGLILGVVYFPIVYKLKSLSEKYEYFAFFVVFCVLDLIGLPFVAVSSMSLGTKLFDEKSQGFAQGLQRAILGVGTILGPLIAGVLIEKIYILLVLMLVSVVFVSVLLIFSFKYFDED